MNKKYVVRLTVVTESSANADHHEGADEQQPHSTRRTFKIQSSLFRLVPVKLGKARTLRRYRKTCPKALRAAGY